MQSALVQRLLCRALKSCRIKNEKGGIPGNLLLCSRKFPVFISLMGINFVKKIDKLIKVETVLISVSDKAGLESFIPAL